jgi:hypothetical protein
VPSSMIFLGLVVVWLLILVPAVARHRQEVARPSDAALSGRVLDRPRRGRGRRSGLAGTREEEVDVTEHDEERRSVAVADGERSPARTDPTRPETDHDDPARSQGDRPDPAVPDDTVPDDTGPDQAWERPAPRYRPGRGGFNPEAAALAARARYAFRQRVVLTVLVLVVATALAAGFLASWVWWLHALTDVSLVGYLAYLRRQVRLEEAIRERRAARMAGTRRMSAAEDPDLDDWARRGRDASGAARQAGAEPADDEAPEPETVAEVDEDPDDELTREQPERVAGTGAPLWRGPGPGLDMMEVESALPRMQPSPPPPLPAGTSLVETDLEDPELHDLDDSPARPDYRRAVGE